MMTGFCREFFLIFASESNIINIMKEYDVIVIGGGHAGTEACLASARCGAKTFVGYANFQYRWPNEL